MPVSAHHALARPELRSAPDAARSRGAAARSFAACFLRFRRESDAKLTWKRRESSAKLTGSRCGADEGLTRSQHEASAIPTENRPNVNGDSMEKPMGGGRFIESFDWYFAVSILIKGLHPVCKCAPARLFLSFAKYVVLHFCCCFFCKMRTCMREKTRRLGAPREKYQERETEQAMSGRAVKVRQGGGVVLS